MRLYILLDTSGSMDGSKISALNDSMENIIIDLQERRLTAKTLILLSYPLQGMLLGCMISPLIF